MTNGGVTRKDGIWHVVVRFRNVVVREHEDKVASRVLKWFGHMERKDLKRVGERVMK